jgi:hypothetical protein
MKEMKLSESGHKKCPDRVDLRDQENRHERAVLPKIQPGVQTGSVGAVTARGQKRRIGVGESQITNLKVKLLAYQPQMLYDKYAFIVFCSHFFKINSAMAERAFAFEDFPRGKLPAQLTRRQFFAGLMNEVRAFAREENHPVYRLSDLGDISDAELAFVVPVLLPGSEVAEREGFMWGRAPGGRNRVRLFPADSAARFVLEQLDGQRSIVDASRSLAGQLGWEKQRAFAYVRGVFLWLVLAKLCAPKGRGGRDKNGNLDGFGETYRIS